MRILRTKSYSEREAYIKGYKNGAEQVLKDSLTDATKLPEVKKNGKAIKEMLDHTEEMLSEVPEIAEEAANEEKLYSENLQAVIEKIVNHIDTMKIGKFVVMEDKSDGDEVCISGGLNGRGIWSNYFETLAKFMYQVELRFPDAYVVKLENDCLDDVFYLTIKIPKGEAQIIEGAIKDLKGKEQKEFGDKEPPKKGNKKPGNREIVPASIVKKVENGEGVIHKYNGYWRIVSMKTNPPTFWDAKYESKEKAENALSGYHASKR
jgi:hypothetical protein